MNDTVGTMIDGPTGAEAHYLCLDAGTVEDQLAAVLEFHKLPKPGTIVKHEGKQVRLAAYDYRDGGLLGLNFRVEIRPYGLRSAYLLWPAEVAALEIVEEAKPAEEGDR